MIDQRWAARPPRKPAVVTEAEHADDDICKVVQSDTASPNSGELLEADQGTWDGWAGGGGFYLDAWQLGL